jgi:hypothetical protein
MSYIGKNVAPQPQGTYSQSEIDTQMLTKAPTDSPVFTGDLRAERLLAYGNGGVSTNVAVGTSALYSNTTGYSNVAVGYDALYTNTTGRANTAVGESALKANTYGSFNVANGDSALYSNTTGWYNVANGWNALYTNTTGGNNIAVGKGALYSNTTAWNNVAVGRSALYSNTIGGYNVAIGDSALKRNISGDSNTSFGCDTLANNTTGSYNVAFGIQSLLYNISGDSNTAIGSDCLNLKQDLSENTDLSNCTGLGCEVRVSGSNQVQLGNSDTTTYVYGTVQNRSDIRDKTDITTTVLGLDFINKIRPVDFRWDMRDDYFETVEETKVRIVDGVEETYTETKLIPIEKDGSKKRNRKHHGVIAQEVKEVMDEMNVDFAGYQDHAVNGGTDVLTIGYDEFIAPLIKAVQELSARVKELESK